MRAHLRSHELENARSLGLVVDARGEKLSFLQACRLLNDKKCAVYDRPERPQVCGRYRCKLLKHFLAGEVDLDMALAKVRSTRDLLTEIQQLIPFGKSQRVTLRNIRLMTAYLSTLTEEERQPHAAFLDAVTRYLRLITREFVYFMDATTDEIADTEMTSR